MSRNSYLRFAKQTAMNGHTKKSVKPQTKKTAPTPVGGEPPIPMDIDRIIYRIPINLIDPAPYNPPGRDDKSSAKVKRLAADMAVNGQLVPIRVKWSPKTGRFETIFGHCRKSGQELLGSPFVAGEVVYEQDTAHQYTGESDVVNPHNSNNRLYRWLVNHRSVSQYMGAAFANMEAVIGNDLCWNMARRKYGLPTYQQARGVASYCDREGDARFIVRALRWLMDHRMTNAFKKSKEAKIAAIHIVNAIYKNKPLCPSN